jgi:hypothetical protein
MAKGDIDEIKKIRKEIEDLIKSQKFLKNLTISQQEGYVQMVDTLSKGKSTLNSWKTLSNDITNSIDDISDGLDYIAKSYADSLQDLVKQNVALSLQKKSLKSITSIANDLSSIRKGEVTYTDKQLKKLKEKADASYRDLIFARDLLEKQGKNTDVINKQIDDQKELNKGYKEIEETNKKINKQLGFTPAILSGIDKSLQKLGFGSLGISDAVAETKKLGQRAEMLGKPFNALGTFTKTLGKNLLDSISLTKILEVLFVSLVTSMKALDKATGETAKNLGISYSESLDLQKSFNQIALNSDNIMVSSKALNESFKTLNESFSGATNFSKQTLESFTKLTKQANISSDAIVSISLATGATGKELENQTSTLLGQISVLGHKNKISISEKQVLEGIAKMSKATLLTLQQQPKQLAIALTNAKKLALSFQQMESISSSLLDFESSIQNELAAELLVGKDINLEKARQFALEGNIGKAAEEVAKQVGSAAEFGKMNVIQQEALAKAAGLTREDLAKSLMEREALAKLGAKEGTALEAYNDLKKKGYSDEAIAAKLGDENLAKQLKSQSIQEKFAASVERMKEVFIDVGAALMPIISGIADGVVGVSKFIAKWGGLIKVLGSAFLIIKGMKAATQGLVSLNTTLEAIKIRKLTTEEATLAIEKLREGINTRILTLFGLQDAALAFQMAREEGMNVLKALRLAMEETILGSLILQGAALVRNLARLVAENVVRLAGMVTALTTNAAVTFGVGAAIAVAAATAGYFAIKGLAGDMLSPAKGKTQVSPREGGIYELSDNDDLVAAPGAANRMKNGGGTQMNIAPLVAKMNQLIAINQAILAKSPVIEMGGNEVGQGINTAEREIQ